MRKICIFSKGGVPVINQAALVAGLIAALSVVAFSCSNDSDMEEPGIHGTFTDPADGTVYRTIRIGDQVWMVDNMNRGEMIIGRTDQQDNGIVEKYCYDNNPVLCENYGGLYQWEEAMQYSNTESSQGICPDGWHIPSDSEWMILEILLGMPAELAGEASKWRGNGVGIVLQTGGESGFEALRAGNRFVTGAFGHIGNHGYFWTSTADADGHAWRRGIGINREGVYRAANDMTFGFSVRCIRY